MHSACRHVEVEACICVCLQAMVEHSCRGHGFDHGAVAAAYKNGLDKRVVGPAAGELQTAVPSRAVAAGCSVVTGNLVLAAEAVSTINRINAIAAPEQSQPTELPRISWTEFIFI